MEFLQEDEAQKLDLRPRSQDQLSDEAHPSPRRSVEEEAKGTGSESGRGSGSKTLSRQGSSTPRYQRKSSSSTGTKSDAQKGVAMKAVFVNKIGEPLVVREILIPRPGPNEVLIRVEAAPINPSDIAFMTGHYVHLTPPFQIGLEGAGVVISAGPGSAAAALVDKRVSFAAIAGKPGSWAQFIVTQAQNCFVLENNISFEHGACGIINPFTAIAFTEVVKKEKHKTVVLSTGASQLGRMITRLLKKEGVKIIDIIGKPEQKKLLEDLGAEVILNTQDENFEAELKKKAEEMKASCLLECVSGDVTRKLLKAMPKDSVTYIYDLTEHEFVDIDLNDILFNNKSIKPFSFSLWFNDQGFFTRISVVKKAQNMLTTDLKTEIGKSFSMEDVNAALDYFKQHVGEGKIILKPDMVDREYDPMKFHSV